MKDSKFLTRQEAADYLGISLRALERMMQEREIPFYKFGDSNRATVRISRTDLEKWVAKFRREAIA